MSHADYLKPWVETTDLRDRIDSIVKVVRLILDGELHDDIARRLYKEMTWEATELGGKYSTRYRSAQAHPICSSPLPVGEWAKQVTHEHFVPRRQLRQQLSRCQTDDEIRRVLHAAQGCVIDAAEHVLLDDTQTGWLRYVRSSRSHRYA